MSFCKIFSRYDELRKQFQNLADVPDFEVINHPRLKILLLADDRHAANVVMDHIQAFMIHSSHEFVVMNPIHIECPEEILLRKFDAILIHYSLYILGEYFLPMPWIDIITRFGGLKAQIIQDEQRNINSMKQRMADLGITVVFSSLEIENTEKVYSGDLLNQTTFYSCLPGYVARNFFDLSSSPISERPLHVVYRGRTLPAYLGRHAQEKRIIGEQLFSIAEQFGLSVDISSDEDSRIYGNQWPQFLMSGRATLGVEGGASIFDFDGSITEAVSAYQKVNPNANFEEIWCQLLQKHEGNVIHKTLTPKLLESIATKTALILYPGLYRGILEPFQHYIPLERDGSNIHEVVAFLRDAPYLQNLVDRTHSEILWREDITLQFYIQKIDYVLAHQ